MLVCCKVKRDKLKSKKSTPGDAEQEVIDQVNDQQNASSGSSQAGGTIATTAAGLLSGDDAALRRRRALQGSGLIT